MSKRLFSVVLLASLFVSACPVFASTPKSAAAVDGKVVAQAQPSVVTRAANAVASTARSAASTVKSAAKSAASTASDAVVKSASATSALVVAAYNLSWVNNKALTCGALASLTALLLYNYNDTVKSSVRGFFGWDEDACRFCPSACSKECASN